jgi:hypothetical protein
MPFLPVVPVIDKAVRGLCCRPYEGHPVGCPNFMHVDRCPPKAPLFCDVFDMASPFFAVWSTFQLGDHVRRMTAKHPEWTDRQQRCVLYWQGTARKKLKGEIAAFLEAHPLDWLIETTPEAFGCNVTATMKAVGIELHWPPTETVYHVAIAGFRTLHRRPKAEPSAQLELLK